MEIRRPTGEHHLDEFRADREDERFRKLIAKPEIWATTVNEIINSILEKPDWLIDKTLLGYKVVLIRELLEKLKTEHIEKLDGLDTVFGDSVAKEALVMRFMEIFSERFDFPYVWRGGDLEDTENRVTGTFTYIAGEAKYHVFSSHSVKRKEPCLIGLPVKAIIEYYITHRGRHLIDAEHGFDGIFTASFDIKLPVIPDGLVIYLP